MEGNGHIEPPVLPACLLGEEPNGCHQPPNLPNCLEGDTPEGCAAPPMLADWECPAGWRTEVIGEDEVWEHSICSVPAPETCAAGTADWLGDPAACETIGRPCPTGTFHPESEIRAMAPGFDGAIWYVSSGGNGDGTVSSPFGTMQQAMVAAAGGDIVALSADTFSQGLELTSRVAIVGACVTGTVLSGPSAGPPRTVSIQASGARLTNLQVQGPGAGIVVEQTIQDVALDAVEVRDATYAGVLLWTSASADVSDLVIRGITPAESIDDGWGLAVRGASLQAHRVLVEAASNYGVLVDKNADAKLEDAVVRNVQAVQGFGGGVLFRGVTASITRSLLEDNEYGGLIVQEPGACDIDTLVVRGTVSSPSTGEGGLGLGAFESSVSSARQVLLDHNETTALIADAALTATGLVMRETQARSTDGRYGAAAMIQPPADIHLDSAVAVGNHEFGVQVFGDATSFTATDLVIADTKPSVASLEGGTGLQILEGASATLERVWLARNHYVSTLFMSAATGDVTDLTIVDSLKEPASQDWGVGFWGSDDAIMAIRRLSVLHSSFVGIGFSQSSLVALEDVLISDVAETPTDGGVGIYAYSSPVNIDRVVVKRASSRGVELNDAQARLSDAVIEDTGGAGAPGKEAGFFVFDGSVFELERARILDSDMVGVFAYGSDTRVNLTDVEISGVRAEPFEASSGGIVATDDGQVVAERLSIKGAEAVGIYARWGAAVKLTDALIADTVCDTSQGVGGFAIYGLHEVNVEANRIRLTNNQTAGILLAFPDTTGAFHHLLIDRTAPPDCMDVPYGQPGSCFEKPGEIGNSASVGAGFEARVELSHFDLGHARCGIQVAADAVVKASNGSVHDHKIGANIRVPDYDLETLLGPNVRYYDNETQLDTQELRLPGLPSEVAPP
jgi:Right handed beta helix region